MLLQHTAHTESPHPPSMKLPRDPMMFAVLKPQLLIILRLLFASYLTRWNLAKLVMWRLKNPLILKPTVANTSDSEAHSSLTFCLTFLLLIYFLRSEGDRINPQSGFYLNMFLTLNWNPLIENKVRRSLIRLKGQMFFTKEGKKKDKNQMWC